jgi:non-heme chloroperoxidase
MSRIGKVLLIVGINVATVLGVALALAIFCQPHPINPLHSVTDPFEHMDTSSLPPMERYRARDGAELSYRTYPGNSNLVVVLVHGSAGSSRDMHPLADALQKDLSATVLVPDLRGHGANFPHGDISYIGRLDDDMVDFVNALKPRYANRKWVLLGFSSGGGFVLRIAGGTHGNMFDRFILISPYLRYNAPTMRPTAPSDHRQDNRWYDVSVARITGISILDAFGIHHFDGLPVLTFAVPGDVTGVTSSYSFRMQQSFQPHDDYLSDIRHVSRPMDVLVGGKDELFLPEQFASVFGSVRNDIPIVIVPGINHVGMITKPDAIQAVVKAIAADGGVPAH